MGSAAVLVALLLLLGSVAVIWDRQPTREERSVAEERRFLDCLEEATRR